MLLADLGAEVVRVVMGDSPGGWSPEDLCWDRSKTLASMEVDAVGDASQLRRLADSADVLLSDARPGELERRGLDPATAAHRNPSMVHVWLPPFAPHGRWSALPHDPSLLDAVGGFADHHPAVQDRPIASVVPTVAYVHGGLAATAAAAGLLARQLGGGGRAVTVSGLHAMAAALGTMVVEGLDVPEVFSPGKQAAPNFRMYQGSDGQWLYLAALTPDFFFRALDVLDSMDVLVRPDVEGEFANILKPAVAEAVGRQLQSAFSARTRDEWLSLLSDANVPAAPVSTREEWLASDILQAVSGRVEMQHPQLGTVTLPGLPLTLAATPGAVRHLPSRDQILPLSQVWRQLPSGAGRMTGSDDGSDGGRALPLHGLRVIDLSTFVAGPFISSLLADHGADVVKVETPSGEPYRVFSVAYTAVNQRKRGIALDLRRPAGRDAMLELIRSADVLVDNLRSDSLERLGLGADVLAATNPRLIRCTVSAYGDTGPAAGLPGFDPVLQALSGLAAAQGGEGVPVATSAPMHDIGTGTVGALGVLAALFVRARDGVAQRVATSLAAVTTLLQCAELTTFDGRPPRQRGGVDFSGVSAAHRYYRAADGWIAVAATSAQQRTALLRVTAVASDVVRDALPDAALAHHLAEAFLTQPAVWWVDELAAQEVPAAQVLERAGELRDPFLVVNDFSHIVREPTLGRLRLVKSYAQWAGGGSPRPAAGARVGEHSRKVLSEYFPETTVEQLIREGVAVEPSPSPPTTPELS
jgi:crotonobetainyl-CoA:carnitine CoA-transferase CaiB-like acyl-CoA transferase